MAGARTEIAGTLPSFSWNEAHTLRRSEGEDALHQFYRTLPRALWDEAQQVQAIWRRRVEVESTIRPARPEPWVRRESPFSSQNPVNINARCNSPSRYQDMTSA